MRPTERNVTNTQPQKRDVTSEPRDEVKTDTDQLDGIALAKVALDAALEKKALEPVLLEVHDLCSYAEYILLVSGRSDRQVDAIAEGVRDALRLRGRRPLGVEGEGHWSLLDYGDVVVHVFHHPAREHYDLEGLWIEAPRIEIEVPDEARVTAEDQY